MMREVLKEEFYQVIGRLNCSPCVMGKHGTPEYRCDFVTLNNNLVGRLIPRYDGTPDRYFLPQSTGTAPRATVTTGTLE